MQVQYIEQNEVFLISCSIKVPPPSLELSPKKIDSHILLVTLANQYNLKKGNEIFGDRSDEAVMAELSEIDGLETYAPQQIKDLSCKDKKSARITNPCF